MMKYLKIVTAVAVMLLSLLRNTYFDTSQQVIETLKAEVEKHRNGAEPNDDLTMMCLRLAKNQ